MTKHDFLENLDKRIPIRTLACQSKALSNMLQRHLYLMGNAGLIRRDVKMIHLQPELEETRPQELPFFTSPLFHTQLDAGRGNIPP